MNQLLMNQIAEQVRTAAEQAWREGYLAAVRDTHSADTYDGVRGDPARTANPYAKAVA